MELHLKYNVVEKALNRLRDEEDFDNPNMFELEAELLSIEKRINELA